MSQILAIRGEVRNHPLTFEFAIEYNKGVGSRRTAPAQGIETRSRISLITVPDIGLSRRTAPAQGIETYVTTEAMLHASCHEGPPLRRGLKPCWAVPKAAHKHSHEGPPLRRGLKLNNPSIIQRNIWVTKDRPCAGD
jgi:hypothetical protein